MSQDLSGNLRLSGGCVGLDGQAPPFVISQGSLKRPALGFPDASGIYEEADGNNLCIETAGVKRARFDANGLNLGTHSMSCGVMSSSSFSTGPLTVSVSESKGIDAVTISNSAQGVGTENRIHMVQSGGTYPTITSDMYLMQAGVADVKESRMYLQANGSGNMYLKGDGTTTFGGFVTTAGVYGPTVLGEKFSQQYTVNRLQFPTSLSVAAWYKAGNWTSTQQGARFKMEVVGCRDYNATAGMLTIVASMQNQSSSTPNILAYWYWSGLGITTQTPLLDAKWVATTANGTTCQSWDLYVRVQIYLGPDHFYTVDVGPNSTWTHIMTADSDPGAASSLIRETTSAVLMGVPYAAAGGGGSGKYLYLHGISGITQYVTSTNVEFANASGKSFYVPVDCGTNSLTCGAATCSTMNCTTALTLPTSGGTAANMNFFETGSFSATFQSASGTGGTTSTQTLYYVAVGGSGSRQKIVTLYIPAWLITTSNVTTNITTSGTPVPSRIRPSAYAFLIHRMRSNVTWQLACLYVETSGALDFYWDTGGAGYPLSTANSGNHDPFICTYIAG